MSERGIVQFCTTIQDHSGTKKILIFVTFFHKIFHVQQVAYFARFQFYFAAFYIYSFKEQNIAHEFKIGDYEGSWVRGLYKKKKGRDGRLIKDCTILMHGRYKRKAGIAYTGKITWAERISGTGPNDAEKWYKI